MGKVFEWVLGLTKVGKNINFVREKLMGYKTYIAGAALALPAILKIVQSFTDEGTPYLLRLTSTPEYAMLLNGIGFITGRAAISKLSLGA